MVRNTVAEAENNTRTINATVQQARGSRHPKTFTEMLAGNPSTKISVLVSSFQSKERNSMVAEAMEEYVLASAETAYEDPGKQVPMGLMVSGGGFYNGNASHWWDWKNPSFPNQTCSENTNWDTAAVCMSVAKEAIRKSTGGVNTSL